MTNEQKLKDLLIEMELITENEIASRNDLYVLAYGMDNEQFSIDIDGLSKMIFEKVNAFDRDLGDEIIRRISNIRERVTQVDRAMK